MNAKIKYADEPMDDIRVVADFFPSPEELAFREESAKVAISLARRVLISLKARRQSIIRSINV